MKTKEASIERTDKTDAFIQKVDELYQMINKSDENYLKAFKSAMLVRDRFDIVNSINQELDKRESKKRGVQEGLQGITYNRKQSFFNLFVKGTIKEKGMKKRKVRTTVK